MSKSFKDGKWRREHAAYDRTKKEKTPKVTRENRRKDWEVWDEDDDYQDE